jgi:hypothetical protein
MKITQLHPILADLNRILFAELFDNFVGNSSLASASDFPSGGASLKNHHACCMGTLRGQPISCADLARHVTLQHTSANAATGRVAVGWVLDDDVETKEDDLPVVIAVGINYGQGAAYLTNKVRWRDSTQMRSRLNKAGKIIQGPGTDDCPFARFRKNKFHLVAGNFFPWITTCSWDTHGFNGIEGPLLLHCHGFRDPFASLAALLTSAIGKEVSHLFFHGTNTPVAQLGVDFIRLHGSLLNPASRSTSIQVVFCDNLARPNLLVGNSIGLCLERTGYDEKDVMDLDE